jgi:hypothetical protein
VRSVITHPLSRDKYFDWLIFDWLIFLTYSHEIAKTTFYAQKYL